MTRGISVKVFSPKKKPPRERPRVGYQSTQKLINVDLAVVESARIDGDGSLIVAVRPRKSRFCRCRECGKKAPVCVQSIAFRQKMQHGFVTSRAGLLIRFLFNRCRRGMTRGDIVVRLWATAPRHPSDFPSISAASMRRLGPLNSTSRPWCTMRSIRDADFVDANCTKHTRA